MGLSDNLDHCSWMLINQLTIDSDYDCGERANRKSGRKDRKDRKGVIKQLDRLFARKIGRPICQIRFLSMMEAMH